MNKEKVESVPNAAEEQSLSERLNNVVEKLFNNAAILKEVESEKEKLRSEFFNLASEYIEATQTLAHSYIEGEFTESTAKSYIENNCPDWRLVKIEENGILIEEDPSKMKFVWTTDDDIQCSRNIAIVGARFDIDKFAEDYPDLAGAVSTKKIIYDFDEDKASEIIDQSPHLLPVFQNYAYIGKIQTKLASPKIVKDKE